MRSRGVRPRALISVAHSFRKCVGGCVRGGLSSGSGPLCNNSRWQLPAYPKRVVCEVHGLCISHAYFDSGRICSTRSGIGCRRYQNADTYVLWVRGYRDNRRGLRSIPHHRWISTRLTRVKPCTWAGGPPFSVRTNKTVGAPLFDAPGLRGKVWDKGQQRSVSGFETLVQPTLCGQTPAAKSGAPPSLLFGNQKQDTRAA